MRKFLTNVPMRKFSPAYNHETAYKPSPGVYTEVHSTGNHEFASNNNNNNHGQLRAEISKWKRRISLLCAISRSISTILNLIMFACMALVIGTYLATRRDQAFGRDIWPANDLKTWPTIMLLVASLITFLLSVVALCFYCCCFQRASHSWKLIVLTYGIHITLWLIVSFLYRWEKDTKDLWGWACLQTAGDLHERRGTGGYSGETKVDFSGQTKVDFSRLCMVQGTSWILSIVETVMKVLFGIGYFVLFQRSRKVRAAQKLAEGFGEGSVGLLDAFT